MRKWLYAPFSRMTLTPSCSMTTLPHAEHSARRKAYSSHYNLSHLTQFQPEIVDSVTKVVQVSRIVFALPTRTATVFG